MNFSYTGDFYAWVVPTGVSSIIVDAFGAQGGKSSCTYNTVASGGLGGRVQARIETIAGETLYLYVGGQGSSAAISSNTSSAGSNGGGKGGNSQATDVTSSQSLISGGIGGIGGSGGYFGGGGGSWVGGGGGSSYTDAIRSSFVTHSQGSMSGSGLLTFTYTVELPVITASVNGNANIVKKGEQIQVTANVDQAGNVTFFANGKRIVGCTAISAVAGNVVCNWKPTVQGSTSITASIYQNGVLRSTSAALVLRTARRAGFR